MVVYAIIGTINQRVKETIGMRNKKEMTPEEMMQEYYKQVAEQDKVKKIGYRLNDYCYSCKKHFDILGWKLCDNGYITYWCYSCLKKQKK